MNEASQHFDAIVVGGGAAGLSAALWCADLGLSALLLEKAAEFGGQLLWTHNEIKNHLGTEAARDGRELRDCFVRQTENYDFQKRLGASVASIDVEDKTVRLETGERFSAKAIILATGVRRRKLGVEGEEFFRGKGIIESGKKDADSVAGKTILIVGGGDAALENSLILAERAEKVYVAHRRAEFGARREFVEKARANRKINLLTETAVRRFVGGERIEAAEIESARRRETETLPVEAVLVRIGVEPNTELVRGKIELDENGYIKVDNRGETGAKNIFAVGDAANPLSPTVSTAVGTGATAAKTIFALLNPP